MTTTTPPCPHRTMSVALLDGPAVAGYGTGRATDSCRERHVSVSASAITARGNVMVVAVTNRTGEACVVGRPTVTFGALDGPASPVPWGGSESFRLEAGQSAHAAVRTALDIDSGIARVVHYVTIAASPTHQGTRFSVAELGFGELGLYVCDPVTTWWHPTPSGAEQTLFEHLS